MFWIYGDNVVKRGFPAVGTIIIAINILIYLLMAGLWREDMERRPAEIKEIMDRYPYVSQRQWDEVRNNWYPNTEYEQFSNRWAASSTHVKKGHVMSLLTCTFVHGGFMHIFGNMIMMWAILGTLEITLGQVRFMFCYIFWGVAASLAQVAMSWDSGQGTIGASGAIAGMVGAYFLAFGALTKLRCVFFLGFRPIYFQFPTGVCVFVWILMQLSGIEDDEKFGHASVAWFAHLGGFAAGVGTMLIFRRNVLSKMIRNKAGDLQALDDDEREQLEKAAREKAEREGLIPPEGEANSETKPEGEEAAEGEKKPEEEPVPAGPSGIRPWHVILGISALMLAGAVFLAFQKEGNSSSPLAEGTLKEKEKPKPTAETYEYKGKKLTEWIDALKDENNLTRREAADALRAVDSDAADLLVPALTERLKDDDAYFRQLSAYVLGHPRATPEKVVPPLDTALHDKDKNVRQQAAMTLVQVGARKPEALSAMLQKGLADSELEVRRLSAYVYQMVDPDGSKTGLKPDLRTIRQGFRTQRVATSFKPAGAAPKPPADTFKGIRYEAPSGQLMAYITPDPGDGKKHPAVLWAHGGFGGIGSYLWKPPSRANDQSARAFREAGIVLMCPSWRGENDNPGKFEMFLGEVDDLLAARDYLAGLSYVDPERIYLAGHSTGGTLVLLAATATDQFRAAFSFGGAPDIQNILLAGGYGNTPFNTKGAQEAPMRSATLYVSAIKQPTFYFEGEDSSLYPDALVMQKRAKKAGVPFDAFMVKGANHFDILDPLTRLVARKILSDTGDICNITISAEDVQKAYDKRRK